jgi:DNA mismatch repair protein MutS2
MDEKTLNVLEFPKVLERLAAYSAFSASGELARSLRPSADLDEVLRLQKRTSEAFRLLSVRSETSLNGAHDIRPLVDLARRGGVLEGSNLLDIKNTLIIARDLARSFERQGETYPTLIAIAAYLSPPPGVVDAISRAISERGELLDTASDQLTAIRRELKLSHDRLMTRLERMINDAHTAPMLQEAIITQRNGRYVIPLRAEFKGRIRAIIHDQSASGATLFIEPLVVVELNNRWHEQQLAERDEERRILADLSQQVGLYSGEIDVLVQGLAEFDLALMCAKYSQDLHAVEPQVVPMRKATETHPGTTIKLYQARHPLLSLDSVVPVDVDLDEKTFALVITGPNTGGKTVTLKTIGLLVLMAQSGLHIPAQSGSILNLFSNVYADIGDEQSIEQSLSTFSGHITNIVRIFHRAGRTTLVLLDELGAGTDPQEGAALARALLAYLVERQVTCLVATHYPELKAYAHTTPGAVNASMEFDLHTLRPTYHLTIGLPGRSNALLIAERLGLPKPILESARSLLDPNDLHAEDLLDEIHRQRDLARKARTHAELMQGEAARLKRELAARLEKIEDERLVVLEKARQEAEEELVDLRTDLEELRRAMGRARQPLEAIKSLQSDLDSIEDAAQKPAVRKQQTVSPTVQPLRVGEKVEVRSLKMQGVVATVSESDVEVQLGTLRIRARLNDIRRPNEIKEEPILKLEPPSRSARRTNEDASPVSVIYPSPGVEIDLRGQRAEDALLALEHYLESAYLANMPYVRIIHGKGTGRLRQVVREALQQSPHVSRWENGLDGEGGEGVTVAHLAKE